jgi:sodium/bile acid cotransporter 7
MTFADRLKRFGIDSYMALLIGTVVLATVLPASGAWADAIKTVSLLAVALLFFLYGAKLDGASVIAATCASVASSTTRIGRYEGSPRRS